jgi:hypothetical protein
VNTPHVWLESDAWCSTGANEPTIIIKFAREGAPPWLAIIPGGWRCKPIILYGYSQNQQAYSRWRARIC